VTSLRHLLTDLHQQYARVEGNGPHAGYARAKLAEAIRRCGRDLIALYGVTLPETDPERLALERMLKMDASQFPEPTGYPDVSEQGILDRHVDKLWDDWDEGWDDDAWRDQGFGV
jgi:hypothetical protein